MKKPLLALCLFGSSFLGKAQQFSLLKDINPGSASSNICYLTNVDNTMFFAATNGMNGMELWKTDGTDNGTVMVKDIKPGSANSSIGYLTEVNHILFFVANNGSAGTELWKSDGTTAGTVMVRDIRPGSMGSNPSGLVNLNGIVYFAADDGINGTELWKSDGTTAGTVLVKDINSLSASSYPQSLANVNGTLYFAAENGSSGVELWKSDGTAAGTILLKDIWPGAGDGYPSGLINVAGTLFFSAADGIKGTELWKSDGTAAGTVLVKDIWPGAGDSYPFSMKSVDGQLFFSADNGTKGDELWKSDGTGAGTVLVKDIWPGIESGAAGNFSEFIHKLVFTGNDGVSGYTTWQSDGSALGTTVATIGTPGNMQELVETTDNIYASITENVMGRELWAISYNSILPVHLLEFNGVLSENNAILDWKTENEINADEFIVERSMNGSNNFSAAGKAKSANTPGVHNYSFTDANVTQLASDVIYYRLKQKDIDGHFTYSKVVTLTVRAKSALVLFPNPAANQIILAITAKRTEKLGYSVFDNAGRIVMQQTSHVLTGANSFTIDINKLPAGVYYLKLSGNSLNEQMQFVKR
ncbi:MAG: ELWxxDGT repeat protein [Chitinophagaceae bacterium]